MHTNTFCKYRKKLLASPRVHLVLCRITSKLYMGIASLYTCKYDITTQLRVMNNCSGSNKYMMQTVVDYPPHPPPPPPPMLVMHTACVTANSWRYGVY